MANQHTKNFKSRIEELFSKDIGSIMQGFASNGTSYEDVGKLIGYKTSTVRKYFNAYGINPTLKNAKSRIIINPERDKFIEHLKNIKLGKEAKQLTTVDNVEYLFEMPVEILITKAHKLGINFAVLANLIGTSISNLRRILRQFNLGYDILKPKVVLICDHSKFQDKNINQFNALYRLWVKEA
jgi:hypothetical protein